MTDIYGTSENDVIDLRGLTDDFRVFGLEGNDEIYGNASHNGATIIGGPGDDVFYGVINTSHGDTFIYNLGDGNDTIYDDQDKYNQLIFGEGITASDLFLYGRDEDLFINILPTNSTILIPNMFYDIFGNGFLPKIYNINIAGIPMIGTDASDHLTGSIYGHSYYGYEGNDFIEGRAGNDTIFGGPGNDIIYADYTRYYEYPNDINLITAGLGDDRVYGSTGEDTYYYNVGDGNDTYINNYGLGIHTLQFGPGIGIEDLRFSVNANYDLIIHEQSGNALITIEKEFRLNNSSTTIEFLKFDDGSFLSFSDYLPLTGTALDDVLYGTAFGNTINALSGNDTIYASVASDSILGGNGDDIIYSGYNILRERWAGTRGASDYYYSFNFGNDWVDGEKGNDTIYGSMGDDTLIGGEGNDKLVGDYLLGRVMN